jgi:D-aspartate ligase
MKGKKMVNKALIIGLYVNGYSIIRELSRDPNIQIVGLDNNREHPGLASKYLSERYIINDVNNNALVDFLINYGKKQDEKVVLYPTHDYHTRVFAEYYKELNQFYHIPVNPHTLPDIINKKNQYEVSEKIGIPIPKSFFIRSISDLAEFKEQAKNLEYPLIIKPFSKADDDRSGNIFRLREINNYAELKKCISFIESHHTTGFLISEVIPGEPDNIWGYSAYCNEKSDVISGWTGRKLTQRPYYYGVFSTARCEPNPIVEMQGKKLIKALNHVGVSELEFKYDYRNGAYKLIEINPRYGMWHIVGWKCGVNLPLIQYYDMTNQKDKLNQMQKKQNNEFGHLVYMPHEIYNLVYGRPKSKFINNIWKSLWLKNKMWAIFNTNDIMPTIKLQLMFLKSLYRFLK